VEGHADEAGAEAGVDVGGVPHGLPDDFLGVRARALVEAKTQLWSRSRWWSLGWWAWAGRQRLSGTGTGALAGLVAGAAA